MRFDTSTDNRKVTVHNGHSAEPMQPFHANSGSPVGPCRFQSDQPLLLFMMEKRRHQWHDRLAGRRLGKTIDCMIQGEDADREMSQFRQHFRCQIQPHADAGEQASVMTTWRRLHAAEWLTHRFGDSQFLILTSFLSRDPRLHHTLIAYQQSCSTR